MFTVKAFMPPKLGSVIVPVLRACALENWARQADPTRISAEEQALQKAV
jgi:hypothetical protein